MRLLITGANGGLGSWLVRVALEANHQVFATVRNKKAMNSELICHQQEYGDLLTIIEMDVASNKSVEQMASYLNEQQVDLDGIVNVAGIMIEREKVLEELDLTAMTSSYNINTIGPMRVIKALLPNIRRGRSPVIINISSEAGTIINAFPTNYPYSMSKTALNMFSERLREYLRPDDIWVYAVHPGWMRTNMGGDDAPANPRDIAVGILSILERKTSIYSKIAFIDSTGRPMPL